LKVEYGRKSEKIASFAAGLDVMTRGTSWAIHEKRPPLLFPHPGEPS